MSQWEEGEERMSQTGRNGNDGIAYEEGAPRPNRSHPNWGNWSIPEGSWPFWLLRRMNWETGAMSYDQPVKGMIRDLWSQLPSGGGDCQEPPSSAKPTMADLYPKYYKDVSRLQSVDVYRVHRLFGVTDNEIHHASKKLLLCGVRTGGKPARKEVEEARDTLNRWLEIQAEEERL